MTNDDVAIMSDKLDVLICLIFTHVDRVCHVKHDGLYRCSVCCVLCYYLGLVNKPQRICLCNWSTSWHIVTSGTGLLLVCVS